MWEREKRINRSFSNSNKVFSRWSSNDVFHRSQSFNNLSRGAIHARAKLPCNWFFNWEWWKVINFMIFWLRSSSEMLLISIFFRADDYKLASTRFEWNFLVFYKIIFTSLGSERRKLIFLRENGSRWTHFTQIFLSCLIVCRLQASPCARDCLLSHRDVSFNDTVSTWFPYRLVTANCNFSVDKIGFLPTNAASRH